MIATIKGTVLFLETSSAVIECGGIGYQVFTTEEVLGSAVVGTTLSLFTYLQVREDGLALFGFLRREEKRLFEQLLAVSGIGPKAAMSIISFMGADGLRMAVLTADGKQISKTPGIGAKTAQKIILELKDKINMEETLSGLSAPAAVGAGGFSAAQADAVMALTALGYGEAEAVQAVKGLQISEDASSDDVLKQALKRLL
jgi:Holliday junction DNA helicase RuvA